MSDKPIDIARMAVTSSWDTDMPPARFDQSCGWGEYVPGHAVYCTNEEWADGPRKCRRTWYTGGETRDEDCEGFKPNAEVAK
jgi:hypothetical protein